jgi:hypothetical protein
MNEHPHESESDVLGISMAAWRDVMKACLLDAGSSMVRTSADPPSQAGSVRIGARLFPCSSLHQTESHLHFSIHSWGRISH